MTTPNIDAHLPRLLPPETRRVVRVDADGWTLLDYVATGRLLQRTMRAGGAEYTADVPEVAPVMLGTSSTLEALADTHAWRDEDDEGTGISAWWRQRDAETAALRDRDAEATARLVAEITRRVLDAAQTADPVDPTDRIPCRNCDGTGGGISSDCWCKDNGHHYLGVIAEADDIITDDPTGTVTAPTDGAPVYDPDCDRCHGTGTSRWTCAPCQGTGTWPAVIDWHITGPDGSLTVRRDAASLLRTGGARLEVTTGSRNRLLDITVRLDLTPLIDRIDRAVAAGQPTWVRHARHFDDWPRSTATGITLEMKPAGTRAPNASYGHTPLFADNGPFQYAAWDRRRATGTPARRRWVDLEDLDRLLPTGADLLTDLQTALTDQPYGQPTDLTGYAVAADGLLEGFPYVAAVKIPGETLLTDMVTTASAAGFGIGLTYGFIATGQTGPQVYLLGADDRPLAEIGLSYTWQAALADAHAALPHVLERARDAGYGTAE